MSQGRPSTELAEEAERARTEQWERLPTTHLAYSVADFDIPACGADEPVKPELKKGQGTRLCPDCRVRGIVGSLGPPVSPASESKIDKLAYAEGDWQPPIWPLIALGICIGLIPGFVLAVLFFTVG